MCASPDVSDLLRKVSLLHEMTTGLEARVASLEAQNLALVDQMQGMRSYHKSCNDWRESSADGIDLHYRKRRYIAAANFRENEVTGEENDPRHSDIRPRMSHRNTCRKSTVARSFSKTAKLPFDDINAKPVKEQLTCTLYDLAKKKAWPAVIKFCDILPHDAQWLTPDGDTVLHLALDLSAETPLEVLEAILRAYPAALFVQNKRSRCTPIMTALRRSSIRVFELLMARCGRPCAKLLHSVTDLPIEVVTRNVLPFVGSPLLLQNFCMETPLQRVLTFDRHGVECEGSTLEKMKHLLTTEPLALIEPRYGRGLTPLHYVLLYRSRYDTFRMIFEACPEAALATDKDLGTPLHLACSTKAPSLKKIELLVNAFPDALKMQDKLGLTPLFVGMKARAHTRVIRFLVEACPAAVTICDNEGNSPLNMLKKQYIDVLHMAERDGVIIRTSPMMRLMA